MQAHHLNNAVLVAHLVIRGEEEEEQPPICSDTSDLSRLLLHRLKVLEAALRELEGLQCRAADGTQSGHPMSLQPSHDMLATLRDTLRRIDADPAPTDSLLELRAILLRRIDTMEATYRILDPRMNSMRPTASLYEN
jgi:hypothetical protein